MPTPITANSSSAWAAGKPSAKPSEAPMNGAVQGEATATASTPDRKALTTGWRASSEATLTGRNAPNSNKPARFRPISVNSAALAALFTLIGLNLAGLFEFGAFLPVSVASLEARHPVVNAFLSGVLAVAVASPCTAPFMGASLGFALGLPAAQALLLFAVIGVGMALPYLAASWVPAIARWLPKPGAWMENFRKFMAFPMFATVAWLVWVLGQQSGIDGAGALLALLVALSMVVWAFTLRGRA